MSDRIRNGRGRMSVSDQTTTIGWGGMVAEAREGFKAGCAIISDFSRKPLPLPVWPSAYARRMKNALALSTVH